jgi:hypothetical protein
LGILNSLQCSLITLPALRSQALIEVLCREIEDDDSAGDMILSSSEAGSEGPAAMFGGGPDWKNQDEVYSFDLKEIAFA